MQVQTSLSCSISHPGSPQDALNFIQDPHQSLAKVKFIRDLHIVDGKVRAKFAVNVPMLGEQLIPFQSIIHPTEDGATLESTQLDKPAWAEVSGKARLEGSDLHYDLEVTVHFEIPEAQKWGGNAFLKMVEATAKQTLDKVSKEFPRALKEAVGA
ncbi:DUF3809 domain-containing protein [Deinococcus roseus]|uniref:Carbon monoxide dehydrogenase n=1 Tax=Deinococcus roseus TaxID=392414 RepID=A0ABQ2DFJ3_9DEIO|nr:DUF3809 domain-containing protein [Deinococcus roseus]GGJ56223.1 hypothetical protein GCM10008938_47980 [Deinococcus roseus]